MNLLLLFSNLQNAVGGIPHYNRLLTRALRESDATRTLTVLALHDAHSPDGSRVITGNGAWRYQGFEGNRLAFCREAIRAGRASDVVIFGHVHFAPLAWTMPAARKSMVAHGIEVWEPTSRWRLSGIRRMRQIWSVSGYTRDRLRAWSGVEQERFHLLPNTLSPDPTPPTPGAASLNLPDRPLLLCVSRLDKREPYKNIDSLLDALIALPKVFLVVVGEGSDRRRLEMRARKNGVAERVRFTGAISDEVLRDYYGTCDVFALPSTGEGFGIVFLEAMAHGKPCVGARAGGVPDVIEDDVTGRLVKPGDTPDLVKALRQLFSDSTVRRRLGCAGAARFENEFAYPHFCRRVQTLMASETAPARTIRPERLHA